MTNLASRTALAFLAVFTAAGCTVAGDRAADGVCPEGETCSDLTPTGLYFFGEPTTDGLVSGVGVTAKGGTQTITALLGDALDSPPLDTEFDATTSDIKVAAVSAVEPPNVVISGEGAGTSFVRLLEPGTDKLLDRVSVDVAAIDNVTLRPSELYLLEKEEAPWALLAGGNAPMIVRLSDASGVRLVDDSLTLTSSTGATKRQSWDLFEATAPASGDASFAITAGSAPFTATAKVVAALDDIVSSEVLGVSSTGQTFVLKEKETVCFLGKSGGVTTAGATWSFKGSSNLELTPVDTKENTLTHTFRSCITVKGTAVGTATLTVDAGGISKDFTLDVVKEMARSMQRKVGVAAAQPLHTTRAGERAGGV